MEHNYFYHKIVNHQAFFQSVSSFSETVTKQIGFQKRIKCEADSEYYSENHHKNIPWRITALNAVGIIEFSVTNRALMAENAFMTELTDPCGEADFIV